MLEIREMNREDMVVLKEHKELYPLMSFLNKERSFNYIIVEDENICGGLLGYIDNKNIIIYEYRMISLDDKESFTDALLRYVVFMFPDEEFDYIFISSDDYIFEKLGFNKINSKDYNNILKETGVLSSEFMMENLFLMKYDDYISSKPCNNL